MASSTPVDRRPPASGRTRLAAVVGSPVRHSLSPPLLNAAIAAPGLDRTITALEVAEGDLDRALVLIGGAGGAARAVGEACGTGGAADIAVVNRTPGRAQSASELAGGVGRVVAPAAVEQALARADLGVNATPGGMSGGPAGDMPVDADVLRVGQVAVDLVYHPLETPWLAALRRRGIEAHGGLSMLLFQAARAFSLWTGDEAPVAAMEAAARAVLSARPAD